MRNWSHYQALSVHSLIFIKSCYYVCRSAGENNLSKIWAHKCFTWNVLTWMAQPRTGRSGMSFVEHQDTTELKVITSQAFFFQGKLDSTEWVLLHCTHEMEKRHTQFRSAMISYEETVCFDWVSWVACIGSLAQEKENLWSTNNGAYHPVSPWYFGMDYLFLDTQIRSISNHQIYT